jgi:hypothetical protein
MTMPDTRAGGRDNTAIGEEQALPGTGSDAREQIRQARDKVVDQAKSTFRDARERAGSSLNDGRRKAADQIGGLGGALHRTSEQLRQENQAQFADVADSVGRQIDRVAGYLRDSDGRTIARDIESLARRQPAIVFAGAFALGLMAARFLKSSDPGSDDAGYERIGPGGEPAGLGSGFDAGAGGFDAPA